MRRRGRARTDGRRKRRLAFPFLQGRRTIDAEKTVSIMPSGPLEACPQPDLQQPRATVRRTSGAAVATMPRRP